jgi:hypothetical protein
VSEHRTTDVAVRVASLPLLGALGVLAVVRDSAARTRLREPDPAIPFPRSPWEHLSAGQRASTLHRDDHGLAAL